jgi:parallel beta-helix repeat protein
MDAFCVFLDGDDSQLVNSTVEYCGQAGVAAYGARVTVSGNRVAYNNTRGFNANWEAGGMKFTGGPALTDSTVSNNTAVYNNGDGIWFDWTPRRVLIENNTASYNSGHGIHFEASQAGTIRNNLTYGNGARGIYALESTNTTIGGNIAFGNRLQGIAVRDGTRSAANPALKPYGNSVTGNTVAWNDARGDRIQFMLPGLVFGNLSDLNRSHATDVTPRYAAGDPTLANPYSQGLPDWRSRSGQDHGSLESSGAMPAALAAALAERRLLLKAELPPLLQTAGAR